MRFQNLQVNIPTVGCRLSSILDVLQDAQGPPKINTSGSGSHLNLASSAVHCFGGMLNPFKPYLSNKNICLLASRLVGGKSSMDCHDPQ